MKLNDIDRFTENCKIYVINRTDENIVTLHFTNYNTMLNIPMSWDFNAYPSIEIYLFKDSWKSTINRLFAYCKGGASWIRY